MSIASPSSDSSTSPRVPDAVSGAYAYCRALTRTHAKSFYFCAKFLPAHKQDAIYAVYALCRHLDDLVDVNPGVSDAEKAALVADWGRALDEVYYGTGVPDHPVFIAWKDLIRTYPIDINHPKELMEGVLMDLTKSRYETFEELRVYAYRVASLVGLMTSEIFGYRDRSALQYAVALGIAFQLTNILRDVGEDVRRGRIYIPLEDLDRFSCSEADILAGNLTPNVVSLIKFQISRARDFYRQADLGIPLLSSDSQFTVCLSSRVYGGILADIERHDYDVFTRRAHVTLPRKFLSLPKTWYDVRFSL